MSNAGGSDAADAFQRLHDDWHKFAGCISEELVIATVVDLTLQRSKLDAFVNPRAFPHVHSDQGLHLALERMGSHHVDILPIVSRANVNQLLGIVTLRDVLDSYGVRHSDRA